MRHVIPRHARPPPPDRLLLALPAALLAPPLAATPAVLFNVFAGAWLFARAQLPVRTALLGEQTVGPVFTAGIRYEAL